MRTSLRTLSTPCVLLACAVARAGVVWTDPTPVPTHRFVHAIDLAPSRDARPALPASDPMPGRSLAPVTSHDLRFASAVMRTTTEYDPPPVVQELPAGPSSLLLGLSAVLGLGA